jgi:hypothetical protein
MDRQQLDELYHQAVQDTIARFEATGSPVITDGEQRKYHNFATYAVDGLPNLSPDGFVLQFVNHHRQWPRLTGARSATGSTPTSTWKTPCALPGCREQAVISPSALSLLYPAKPLAATRAKDSLKTYCTNTKPKCGPAWPRAPIRCRSILLKAGWRTSSTPRGTCSTASSSSTTWP